MQFRIFGVWRLVAAFLVMSYHYVHHAPVNAAEAVAWFERMMPLLDMFFMISGFLIFHRYHERIDTPKAYGAYLIKRLARLYPLHLMTTGFFVAIGLAVTFGLVNSQGAHGGLARYNWSELPANLLLIQAWGVTKDLTFNYVSWSISAEWFCYLMLPVIIYAYRKGGMSGLLSLLAVVIALLELSVATGFMPYETWMKTSLWGAYRAFADFIIGAIVCIAFMRTRLRLSSSLPAWLLMAVTVAGMHLGAPPYLSFLAIAVALFLAAVSEYQASEPQPWERWILPVTNVSFGIYLWHPVMEAVMISLIWRHWVEPSGWIGFYPYLVVPMALTVMISLLSAALVERPANNWILAKAGFKRGNQKLVVQPAE